MTSVVRNRYIYRANKNMLHLVHLVHPNQRF